MDGRDPLTPSAALPGRTDGEMRTFAFDTCAWCGTPTDAVIVTVNGWVHNACTACGRAQVDHLSAGVAA